MKITYISASKKELIKQITTAIVILVTYLLFVGFVVFDHNVINKHPITIVNWISILISVLFGLVSFWMFWVVSSQTKKLEEIIKAKDIVSDKLQENIISFQSFIEQASDSIMIANQNGENINVNSNCCRLLGYTKDELLELKCEEIVFYNDDERLLIKESELLKEEKYGIQEARLKRKDGYVVDVEINSWKLPDKRLVRIVRDITERKNAEKAEKEISLRLKAIFNRTSDAIVLANDSRQYVQVNPAAAKMLGYTEEELLNLTVDQIVSDKSTPVLWNEFLENGDQIGVIELIKKDGDIVIAQYNAAANVLPGLHLSIFKDVTESKRTEQLIRENEAKLVEAQRLGQYGYWNFDITKGKLTWSEELFKLFDTDKNKFDQSLTSFINLLDKTDREMVVQTNQDATIDGKPFDIEYQITTAAGEKRVIHERGFAERDSSGKVIRLFGTAQNITERKKAEEEIKVSYQKLRELTSHLQKVREDERTRIAREIHDDLGQQLTALKMDASWIGKRIVNEHKNIQEKLSTMISLIDDTVKTVRRISTELRPGILDDLGLIPALEWQSQEFEKRSGIKSIFTTEIYDVKLEKNLSINLFRVYQEALTNIVRHAQATIVETRVEYNDDFLKLVVKDNGCGFDLQEAENIKSWGIVGMKERALMIQGELKIKSEKLKGTILTLKVKL